MKYIKKNISKEVREKINKELFEEIQKKDERSFISFMKEDYNLIATEVRNLKNESWLELTGSAFVKGTINGQKVNLYDWVLRFNCQERVISINCDTESIYYSDYLEEVRTQKEIKTFSSILQNYANSHGLTFLGETFSWI